MSDIKAFEIHTYQGGKWKIDSVFDDRDLAMFEAQRMDGSGRFSAVRVVEEIFSEKTQETKTRTIFRGSKIDGANNAELEKSRNARQNPAQPRKKRPADAAPRKRPPARRPAQKRGSSSLRLVAITLMIVIVAGAALVGLQVAQNGF
jgi:ferric-dicitrate binding protein FerR (iron transport regulator)